MECTSPLPYMINLCSGNGYMCSVPDIGCICNSGWTSLSDFSYNSDGPDCLINYNGIRIMSYICIVLPSICNMFIIWHYISLGIRKKSYYVISLEYKHLFPFCFFIMGSASAIFGILKVAYPDGQQPLVGRDVSISLMVFINTTCTFIGLVLYLQVIILFFKGYTRMMTSVSRGRVTKRLNSLGFYSWFVLPPASITSVLPLVATAYPSQADCLCKACLIGIAISGLITGFICYDCLTFLTKELNIYIGSKAVILSKDIQLVVQRLSAAKSVVIGGTVVYVSVAFIFASSNFLFYLSSYAILFAFIFCSPQGLVLVLTVARVSQSESHQIVPTNFDLNESGNSVKLKEVVMSTRFFYGEV